MASLTEILILRGIVPIEKLDMISGERDKDDQAVLQLLDQGVVTQSQLASARAAQAGLPYVELLEYPIDQNAVALVPAAMCRRHEVLPIGIAGDYLMVAMVDPGDVFALDDVRAASRMQARAVVAERSDLRAAIDRYHRADNEINSLTTVLEEESGSRDLVVADTQESHEDDAPIVRFVNLLISQGIQDHASDIHIEPTEFDLRVRYRIDGVLHEMQPAPKRSRTASPRASRSCRTSTSRSGANRRTAACRSATAARKIDLRVATLPTVFGEKVVMRILDNNSSSMAIESLNLLEHNFNAYKASYSKPYGMILVTGPDGVWQVHDAVHHPERGRDAADQRHHSRGPGGVPDEGHQQVQVNPKAGLTFASALRSILRSDPDVVLLGEIRDHETAQIAIEASLTGHLVRPRCTPTMRRAPSRGSPRWTSSPFWWDPRSTAWSPSVSPDACASAASSRICTTRGNSRHSGSGTTHPAGADTVQGGGLHQLLEHRLPRPHRAARGHDGHGRHRAPRRRTGVERRNRKARTGAGNAHAAPGWLGQGPAGTDVGRRDSSSRRVVPGGKHNE